jgi:MFS family permease
MEMGDKQAGLAEWRAYWTLPLAAMLGYSSIALQSYGISPFVAELEKAFGWDRSQVMLGVTVATLLGVVLNFVAGSVADRIGSRPVAITGLIVITGSFALCGTATGSSLNWMLIWAGIGIGTVLVQSTIWTRAIASRFDSARGMAFALALTGTPIASMILPALALALNARFGWRGGFAGVGLIWLAVVLPVVLLFFREAPRVATPVAGTPEPSAIAGHSVAAGLKTKAFYCLLISFSCFSIYSLGIATNLVPLLTEAGATSVASLAFAMGLAGIVARLTVGWLLDRFPGNIIGMFTLLTPLIGCSILLVGSPSNAMLAIAAISFGAAIGAEMDVALYLGTRHFGLKRFAALFGIVIGCAALLSSFSPWLAGKLHDMAGNYDLFLTMIMGVMTLGALAILLIGSKVPDWKAPE